MKRRVQSDGFELIGEGSPRVLFDGGALVGVGDTLFFSYLDRRGLVIMVHGDEDEMRDV